MPNRIQNKPVGGHQIDLLLTCGHINVEPIEAVIFAPRPGDERICNQCGKKGQIQKVGQAYWMDAEDTK